MEKSKFVGKRVLVVDDEEGVRYFLKAVLMRVGFEVTEASNGEEARRKFLAKWHDLVITDLTMPVMNGVELVKFIRNQAPFTPTIMFTTQTDEVKDDGEHADKILGKPANVADILRVVEAALATPAE